jgi:hypothetical protein
MYVSLLVTTFHNSSYVHQPMQSLIVAKPTFSKKNRILDDVAHAYGCYFPGKKKNAYYFLVK